MSPVRKDEDFRSVEISSWDGDAQEEIIDMQSRGELEDLPDKGKPITIWKTDINPAYDLAFSRLKNAGVMPLWMELDQEIGRRTEEVWKRLDWVDAELHKLVRLLQQDSAPGPDVPSKWWQRLRNWFRTDFSDDGPPPPTITSIIAARERERQQFLQRAAEFDKRILTYHDSLPKGAEHLQRLRWLPDRAERIFDERLALTDWWEER